MSEFIRQKQIKNLVSDLAARAMDSEVVKKANNLSDVDPSASRGNLDVYSKTEVQNLISGADNGVNITHISDRDALTGLKVADRIFVSDDGDGKWALYIVTAITDGNGDSSSYEKVADEDSFANALTKEAIKSSYEANANTNAFTDAEKNKVAQIAVSQPVDLDGMESELSSTTATANSALSTANGATTAATNAQNTANGAVADAVAAQSTADGAVSDAAAAQSTANNALSTANSKKGDFIHAVEEFGNITSPANAPKTINVSHPILPEMIPQLFINGLRVNGISYSPMGTDITYLAPYETEAMDILSVSYAHV